MANAGCYAASSLEVNLFFLRIMKEHSLFLAAGFPCKNEEWIERADWFRREFEELLKDTVNISDGRVERTVLESRELVTEFTEAAEKRTECLSGIPIDSELTMREKDPPGLYQAGEQRTEPDGNED